MVAMPSTYLYVLFLEKDNKTFLNVKQLLVLIFA